MGPMGTNLTCDCDATKLSHDVKTALKGYKIRQSYGGACYSTRVGGEQGRYGVLPCYKGGNREQGQEWWGLLQGRGTGNKGEKWRGLPAPHEPDPDVTSDNIPTPQARRFPIGFRKGIIYRSTNIILHLRDLRIG